MRAKHSRHTNGEVKQELHSAPAGTISTAKSAEGKNMNAAALAGTGGGGGGGGGGEGRPPPADVEVLRRAAQGERAPGAPSVPEVAEAMVRLAEGGPSAPVPRDLVEGRFELVYSTLLRKLPLVDWGYMPTKEIMDWDLEAEEMRLAIETLPFAPELNVLGAGLRYDETTSTLSYRVKEKPESTWRVFYADAGLFAADSSKTGLCLVRRLDA